MTDSQTVDDIPEDLIAVIHDEKTGGNEVFLVNPIRVSPLSEQKYFICRYGMFLLDSKYIDRTKTPPEIHYRLLSPKPIVCDDNVKRFINRASP